MDLRRERSGGADWLDAVLYDDVLGSVHSILSVESLRPPEEADGRDRGREVVGSD